MIKYGISMKPVKKALAQNYNHINKNLKKKMTSPAGE